VSEEWRIYQNTNSVPIGQQAADWDVPAPPWRRINELPQDAKLIAADPGEFPGKVYYKANTDIILTVNAALRLRRPLLVTGVPGTGKTSLAYSIAFELGLGPVLTWLITSRSTLSQGLYDYDVLGRVNDMNLADRADKHASQSGALSDRDEAEQLRDAASDIGRYVTLGPLGDALLPRKRPRVLLIDEIDKCDMDLPGDLLHVFERGYYEIPELIREQREDIRVRCADGEGTVDIRRGRVKCYEFPLVVLTSNEERDFPPAFRRRCLHLRLKPPGADDLTAIAREMLKEMPENKDLEPGETLEIANFITKRGPQGRELATDQLLNLLFLRLDGLSASDLDAVRPIVLASLSDTATE
jgi:MoxR-like ATPase